MIKDILTESEVRMHKSVATLEEALKKLRAGRAHASLLDSVMVPYHGVPTSLSQVASVGVESALVLTVRPWEKTLLSTIEKAIRLSNLGLNPASSGDMIRVPLPPLSEERRRELIKRAKEEVEEGKIAIRNIRRDINQQCKDLVKSKKISEDEAKQGESLAQKLTDKMMMNIEKILEQKEKELLFI